MFTEKINNFQLFSFLWIINFSEIIFFNSNPLKRSCFDLVLSTISAFIIIFFLSLPILKIRKKLKNDCCEFYTKNKKISVLISLLFTIFFFVSTCLTLCELSNFIKNTFSTQISPNLVLFLTIVTSCYIASIGIEGLSRATVICLFAILISILTLIISLLPMVEKINFEPFLYDGGRTFFSGTFEIISRSSFLPAILAFSPYLKKNLKRNFVFWNVAVYGLLSLILMIFFSVCGDFLNNQTFLLRTLSTVAKIGDFDHTDIVYLSLWIIGVVIKTSLYIFFCSNFLLNFIKNVKVFKLDCGKYKKIISLTFIGLLIIAVELLINNQRNFFDSQKLTVVLIATMCLMLITGFLMPLFSIFCKIRGEKFE